MNEEKPRGSKCGARTRSGGRCQRRPRFPLLRCNLHGGKSLFGMAHPNYKHGFYSKHCPIGVVLRANVAAAKRLARILAKYEANEKS